MKRSLNNIVLWAPGLFYAEGGIQTYLRSVSGALIKILPKTHLHIISKLDRIDARPQHWPSRVHWHTVSAIGKSGSIKFAVKALFQSLKVRPELSICGHINFSPVFYSYMKLHRHSSWLLCYGFECWGVSDPHKIRLMRNVSHTVSISKYTRDRMVKDGNASIDNAQILPVSFDQSRFKISESSGIERRKKLGYSSTDKIILTVTRLSAAEGYKGYDTLIRLLPRLLTQEPNLKYVLVGKGDDLERIKSLISSLGLDKSVHLAGYVSDEEISSYYNACDLFCMPSYGEGFGIVFLEAMSCGKPVIGGDQDGSRDALCDGDLGFMVNPHDENQIYDRIISVLSKKIPHPIAYDDSRLRAEVVKRYGVEAFENQLQELLINQGWKVG